MSTDTDTTDANQASFHFLTNHAHVLLVISVDEDVTIRELAARVGITERAVMRIIGELDQNGYLERAREGRRNHYTVNPDLPLRHQVEANWSVGDLIAIHKKRRGNVK